jgi:hypothetical protein
MKLAYLFAAALALTLPASVAARTADASQGSLPAGTLLPVSLNHGLNAEKLHAAQTIEAELMQSIPGTSVHRGAKVKGEVVQVGTSGASQQLVLRFDAIESRGQRIPIRTDLRAMASPLEVREAQVPEEMASRGLTPETWTTEQIGGDQVYRGGGPVVEGHTRVGKPVAYGVEGQPLPNPDQHCRGVVADNDQPQAFWLFSVDACGTYGFPDVSIQQAGRNDGSIVLTSHDGKLNVGGGSAMLLRVQ